MSASIGTIIDNGKPEPSGDPEGTSGNSQRISEPEIINGFDAFEPDTERISSNIGGEPRRTRTGRIDRRTKAGRNAEGSQTSDDLVTPKTDKVSLEALLLSLHQMGAAFLDIAELELDPSEAKKLSQCIQNVGKYYAVNFNPKYVAIGELFIVAGGVYGTRFMAYRKRTEMESKKEKMTVISGTEKVSEKQRQENREKAQAIDLNQKAPSDIFGHMGVNDSRETAI